MADIDTAAEREAANELIESGEATGQDFADVVPELLDAYDRLQAENQRLGEERDSLASSLAIETYKYRDAWDENQRLREHIQYYSYCTRQGVRATEASYIEWEEAHRRLGLDIP